MAEKKAAHRPLRAKLIFNAISGHSEESPRQLADIINEMQNRNILPEVYMVHADSQVEPVVRRAINRGVDLIVVAGGDGTIDSVMGAMLGSSATLGIIPTGTRNNLAFNLGIPNTIADAVALLREGRRLKIDVGNMRHGRSSRCFLEDATLGLLSDIYPFADSIQHGDLTQIGNLLSTVVSSTPSHLRMILDGRKRIDMSAYMVLIANMPYIGPRFQISADVSWNDNRLDVFVFSDMSKLDLISYVVQSTGGAVEDARIKHYRVKRIKIYSDPPMPVLADGMPLDLGPVTALVHPRALTVMGGAASVSMGEQLASSPAGSLEVVSAG
jgi:diacylglycerol kinase (ATP)